MIAWPPEAYDPETGIMQFVQGKTGQAMALCVPSFMAAAFDESRGKVLGRLLGTSRGKAWTKLNAEEILRSLRARLGLERYTPHGLRTTAASALLMMGFSMEQIIAVSEHGDVCSLRPCVQEIENMKLAGRLREALDSKFGAMFGAENANSGSYGGTTGKAAAKAGVVGESGRRRSVASGTKSGKKV